MFFTYTEYLFLNRSTSSLLSWYLDYNFKSSAPNNIASMFKKAQSFFLFYLFSKNHLGKKLSLFFHSF